MPVLPADKAAGTICWVSVGPAGLIGPAAFSGALKWHHRETKWHSLTASGLYFFEMNLCGLCIYIVLLHLPQTPPFPSRTETVVR